MPFDFKTQNSSSYRLFQTLQHNIVHLRSKNKTGVVSPSKQYKLEDMSEDLEEIELSQIADKFASALNPPNNSSPASISNSNAGTEGGVGGFDAVSGMLGNVGSNSSTSSPSSSSYFSSIVNAAKATSAFYVVKFWGQIDSTLFDDPTAAFYWSLQYVHLTLFLGSDFSL